jgi:hypothetical protein
LSFLRTLLDAVDHVLVDDPIQSDASPGATQRTTVSLENALTAQCFGSIILGRTLVIFEAFPARLAVVIRHGFPLKSGV